MQLDDDELDWLKAAVAVRTRRRCMAVGLAFLAAIVIGVTVWHWLGGS